MATFRQRGNKWQAQVRRHGFPPISQSFQSKQDAERWARAIEREQDMGAYVCRTEAESTTLSQLIERYKQEVVPGFRGAHTEVGRLANIASAMGKLSLTAITPQIVASYRDQRLRSVPIVRPYLSKPWSVISVIWPKTSAASAFLAAWPNACPSSGASI
jgi:hypothetical protein